MNNLLGGANINFFPCRLFGVLLFFSSTHVTLRRADVLCCTTRYDVELQSWKRSRRASQIVDSASCASLMAMILGKFPFLLKLPLITHQLCFSGAAADCFHLAIGPLWTQLLWQPSCWKQTSLWIQSFLEMWKTTCSMESAMQQVKLYICIK